MQGKIALGPLVFDDLGIMLAAKAIEEAAREKRGGFVVTPNAAILEMAFCDVDYQRILQNALLTLPDGVGVTASAKLLGTPFCHSRVPGVELGETLAALAAKDDLPLFLLGGREGVAARAAKALVSRYAGLTVAGTCHGYGVEVESAADMITRSGAAMVYCCLGAPLQERFAAALSQRISAPILCLGGSLDIYAGDKQRAPKSVQQMGCEWLWRTVKEPSRITRLPAMFSFTLRILVTNLKKHLHSPL